MNRLDFHKILQRIRIYKYKLMSTSSNVKGNPMLRTPLVTSGIGLIYFGNDVIMGVPNSPYSMSGYSYIESRTSTSSIAIGDRAWFNNNLTIISCNGSITIGSDCIFGWNVTVLNDDFHSLDPSHRRISAHESSGNISIGKNVLVYSGATILKNVTIGDNSVIAAGAVVTSSIPANVVAGGVPASIIKPVC